MNSLKYLVNGTIATLVCVFGAILTTSTIGRMVHEPSFWLMALPVAFCFLIPPLVTSALFGRGGVGNDALLGAIISAMLYFVHFQGPWFVFMVLCVFSILGGWLGGKFNHAAP